MSQPESDAQDRASTSRTGRGFGLRTILLLSLILALPIIPFLLLGVEFEAWLLMGLERTTSATTFAAIGAALLAADILIPVPSSTVATLMGARLGIFLATLIGATGTSIGAMLGFEAARRYGWRLAERWSSPAELSRARDWVERYGILVVVLARGLPIVGEATVLAVGAYGMSRRKFLPALWLTNLLLNGIYATLGSWAAEQGWLPVAIGLATILPLIPLVALRRTTESGPRAL